MTSRQVMQASILLSEVIPHSIKMQSVDEIYALLVPVNNPLRPCTKGILDCSVRTCWARASRGGGTHSVISLEVQVTAA